VRDLKSFGGLGKLESPEVQHEPPFGHWVRKRAKGPKRARTSCSPCKSGAVALTQLSNASSFWEVRAAASGYPVPPVTGALTDFGSDEKFVKEIAEAMPSGRAAVFVLVGKRLKEGAFSTGGRLVFFDSYDKSAAGTIRAAFSKWNGNGGN
jgi:nucleoside diphosphate kinase